MNDEVKKSDTLCPLPWSHLHAWPDGKAMLCCIAHGGEEYGKVGDFSKNSFQEIINSEKLKKVRVDLMNGVKVAECEACWKDEALGKFSFRQGKLREDSFDIEYLLSKTHPDGTLENPKIMYMDFRFSNLCNLGCQTCGSPLSSTIANNREENSKEIFNLKEKGVLSERGTITSFTYARPDFMEVDVYPYLEDCKEFYFAGGEPLMHQEHLDILIYLHENKLYDKHISYSTNMTLLKWKKNDFVEIWKNFNDLLFWCSIDGQGEQLEYIREFSKHDTVFKNLNTLLDMKDSCPNKKFKINICYTHSIYNAYYTKEFFEFLYENNILQRIDDIDFNYAYSDVNSPAILPEFAKIELKQKREEDKESPAMKYAFSKFPLLEHYFNAVDDVIDEELNSHEFDRLIISKLEKQKEKIENSLPWLASVIKRHRVL